MMPNRGRCLLILMSVLLLVPPALVWAGVDDIEAVRARVEAAGDADDYKADVLGVWHQTDVTVQPNGLGVATTRIVNKVLRPAGIRKEGVKVLTFDPHTNRLDVLAVRIYREDGTLEEVSLDNMLEQPQTAWGIYWGTKQYVLAIPRLAVGDAVEVLTRMTGFNVAYLAEDGENAFVNAYGEPLQPPVEGHWHDEVHFWSGYPIVEKSYTVRLPIDKPLQFEMYNGTIRPAVLMDGDQMIYHFEMQDIEPFKGEPSMEATPNVGAKLLLATLPTWEDKARWLYEVSEPTFEADDAIRDKVAEITDGLKTDQQKIKALNHWVAENIRYAGTSRGMCEGYTNHDIRETFHDRCGVCKDKAGMLVGMLRVAGYDSYLTMTMARQRVDRVPADQFNHAVTVLRWPDGELQLLDPTWMVKSRDNWSTLEPLQHVVYGLPEGGGLAKSPYFTPEENEAKWRGRSRISPDNTLSGNVAVVAVGAPESRTRRTLAGYHPEHRRHFFDNTFQRLAPTAMPRDIQFRDPVDFSGPLEIECDFTADDYASGAGELRVFRLPMMQTVFGDRMLYDLFGKTSLDERDYGLKLLASRLARIEERIDIPDDWEIVELPEKVEIDGPAAGLKFEIEERSGTLVYSCELRVKRWQIPPDEYANFKEVIEKFEELAGPVVMCRTEVSDVQ